MVSLKFLVFAAALLVTQTQARPESLHTEVSESPFMQIVDRIVFLTENFIQSVYLEFFNLMKDALINTHSFQERLVNNASRSLDKILDFVNTRLDVIKNEGDEKTVKVVNCLEVSNHQAERIVVDLLNRTTGCIVPSAMNVLQSWVNLEPSVHNIVYRIIVVLDRMKSCSGNTVEEVNCVIGEINNIFKIVASTEGDILLKVAAIISDSITLAKEVYPTCVVPNWKQFSEDRIALINSVAACFSS